MRFAVVFIACFLDLAVSKEQVKVNVYYESLCPDSLAFITKQLYEPLQDDAFAKRVNLTLYPYGKASYSFSNKYDFHCDHGPEECRGNKIHVCSLSLIDKGSNTEGFGFNRKALGMIYCLMENFKRIDSNTVDFPVNGCGRNHSIDNVVEIFNCSTSAQGDNLLANVGTLTDALNPPLKGVPTITFDGVNDEQKSKNATVNFSKIVCEELGVEVSSELDICSASSSTVVTRFVLLVAVVISVAKGVFNGQTFFP